MISVIVPIYNVAEYLTKCIESIINQTYKDLDIILVDDGSPDECPQICDEYALKDNRIRVIHKENGGLSDARNAGLDIVNGEHISFIDSDDYIEPDMFEKMYTAMQSEKADICICGYKEVDYNGNIIKTVTQEKQTLSREEALKRLFDGNVYYAIMCNKLFAREVFDNKRLRFPVGKIHEDEFLAHHLYNECKTVSVLCESLYNYLFRDESIMHNVRKSIKDFDDVEVYIERAEFCHNNNMEAISAQHLCYIASDCVRVYRSVEHNEEANMRVKSIQTEYKILRDKIDYSSLRFYRRFGVMLFSHI